MNKGPNRPPSEEKEGQYRSIFDAANDGLIINDLETGRVVEANPAACRMHGYTREEFIGLQLTAFIHPDSQHGFSEVNRAFQSDGVFDTRTLHICRDGSTFYAEWRGTAFTYQGRPCLLGIVRDVSERIQAEQYLRQGVETRTHEQATLLEISHTLAFTLELQPGLILDKLRKIIEYTQGGLFTLEDSTLVTLAMRGTPQLEQSAPIRIHLNTPENKDALFNGHRPILIANMWSKDPQAQFLRSLLDDDGTAKLLKGMRSWMWVPLAVRGRLIGGIGIAETRKNYFTAHHAELALSVANQAAITMINTELYGQAQALAVLEERQRLARNLHDAVNQSLFSAGLIAEVLPRLWERDQEEARQSLEDLRRLTRGAQAEMRVLLAELRPSTVTDSDLGDLLHLLGNALSGRTNLPVAVTVMGEFFLPAEVKVAFYRVCQEALYNVAKHAKASQVEINLKQEGAVIELRIRDDGQGFDTQQTFSGHYGLSMMREHAEATGALLSVTSQPGHGTELTLRWTEAEKKEPL
ncbi:MAG: PAS domain S-box protein [Candidatus Atribacteria bacterium]|nr:PAS domain S-box protein [Candidatus Atribacteria bacterium]